MVHLIRTMISGDVEFAFKCTRAEGWSGQTHLVFEDFLAYDPHGCFIAEVNGRHAGICVATAYQRHGFIGTLIVVPEFRGGGLGTTLFTYAVQYLIDRGMKSISLEGDPSGIPIYQKAGFHHICRSLRFNGKISGKLHPNIQPMSSKDLEAVCSLDFELFGDDRSFFLRRKHERYPEICFVAIEDGKILGYMLANPGEGVLSVGPWAALPVLEHPLALLEHLALAVPDVRLRIGVLESNQPAVTPLSVMPGLFESEPSWRMVRGDDKGPGLSECLYAIGSPAKG